MIASLNWSHYRRRRRWSSAPKRHLRAEEGQTFISFCFYVRIHGWISKFKSTTAAMIVMAARTARSAVAAEIEATQTLAHRSPSAVAAENQPLRRRRTHALSRLLYGLSAGQWPLPSFPSLRPRGESHPPSPSHFVSAPFARFPLLSCSSTPTSPRSVHRAQR
jgi:hypothetical protein